MVGGPPTKTVIPKGQRGQLTRCGSDALDKAGMGSVWVGTTNLPGTWQLEPAGRKATKIDFTAVGLMKNDEESAPIEAQAKDLK